MKSSHIFESMLIFEWFLEDIDYFISILRKIIRFLQVLKIIQHCDKGTTLLAVLIYFCTCLKLKSQWGSSNLGLKIALYRDFRSTLIDLSLVCSFLDMTLVSKKRGKSLLILQKNYSYVSGRSSMKDWYKYHCISCYNVDNTNADESAWFRCGQLKSDCETCYF